MTLPVGNLGTRFGAGKMAFETTRLLPFATRAWVTYSRRQPAPAKSVARATNKALWKVRGDRNTFMRFIE